MFWRHAPQRKTMHNDAESSRSAALLILLNPPPHSHFNYISDLQCPVKQEWPIGSPVHGELWMTLEAPFAWVPLVAVYGMESRDYV